MSGKLSIALLVLALVAACSAVRAGDGIAEAADSLHAITGERRLVLLGEKHGTREIPDLVEALATRIDRHTPFLLGLEVPRTEHAALRRYMDSDGSGDAKSELAAGAFWQAADDQHDGRRSHDMLDLVEAMGSMRRAGWDVAILPYDVPTNHVRDHHWRDAEMAHYLRAAYDALPDGRLLVLTGNVHAMRARPSHAPAQMQEPMGAYLRDLEPLSVDIVAAEGAFWACMAPGRCGPLEVVVAPPVGIHATDEDVFDVRLVLPRFTVATLIGAEDRD